MPQGALSSPVTAHRVLGGAGVPTMLGKAGTHNELAEYRHDTRWVKTGDLVLSGRRAAHTCPCVPCTAVPRHRHASTMGFDASPDSA